MSNWSVLTGTATAFVGERLAVVFSGAGSRQAAERLSVAAAASGGVLRLGAVETLDLLLSEGIAALPAFCLCEIREDGIAAFVRGDMMLRVEGDWADSSVVTGEGVRSWREVIYESVSRVAIAAPDAEQGADAAIRHTQPERTPIHPGEHRVSLLVFETVRAKDSMLTAEVQRLPRTSLGFARRPALSSVPVPEAFPDDLFGEPGPDAEPRASQAEDDEASEYDELFGATKTLRVELAAVRQGDDSAHEPEAIPEFAPAADAAAQPAKQVPSLMVMPDGSAVTLHGALLVGRSPRVTQISGGALPALVRLTEHVEDISRTHLRVEAQGTRVVVEDLGSTNGSVVIAADGERQQLRPGEPVPVAVGDAVELGGVLRLEFRGQA